MRRVRSTVLFLAIVPLSLAAAAVARADIPADYKASLTRAPRRRGIRAGSGARQPGHRRFRRGVQRRSQPHEHSAGYQPISGNDYRPDEMDLPNICKTNTQNMDKWATGGGVYPSETDRYWYYMGYARGTGSS